MLWANRDMLGGTRTDRQAIDYCNIALGICSAYPIGYVKLYTSVYNTQLTHRIYV